MPFHIKRASTAVSSVDVYWKDNNTWTDVYADRKQYSTKSAADAQKATTTTVNGVTYNPSFWSTSTVVTE